MEILKRKVFIIAGRCVRNRESLKVNFQICLDDAVSALEKRKRG